MKPQLTCPQLCLLLREKLTNKKEKLEWEKIIDENNTCKKMIPGHSWGHHICSVI